MEHGTEFLRDLALVLMAGAVTALAFQRLRQPIVLGYLLAGVIIGPFVGLSLVADVGTIETLAELGVVLLMFSLGINFKLHRLASLAPTAGLITCIEVGIMMTLGYLAGQLAGWTVLESVFAAGIVAISSTMIITKLFEERGVKGREAELVFGILVFEDLIVIILIVTLSAVGEGAGVSWQMLGLTFARLVTFLVVFLIVGLLTVSRFLRRMRRHRRSETLLIVSIGLCFGSAILAQAVGFSVALGAFLAGSLVAESGTGAQVQDLIKPVRMVFAAIFFVSIGMLFDPVPLQDHWAAVLLFVAVVWVGKVIGVSTGAFLMGTAVQPAIRAGMSMAQIGEFSYILAAIGVTFSVVGPQVYPMAVAVSVITAFTSPFLLQSANAVALRVDRLLPPRIQDFVSLYGSWIESLRSAPRSDTVGRRVAGLVRLLLFESLLLVTITVGAFLGLESIRRWIVDTSRVPPVAVTAVAYVAIAAFLFPLVVSIVISARRLGSTLALAAFPRGTSGVDYGHEPRRALRLTAEIAIVLVVGTPIVVATLPFVPGYAGPIGLLIVVTLFGVAFWRSAGRLAGHVRATGGLIAEALARQSSGSDVTAINRVRELMPGIGVLTPISIDPGSPGVGRSLAQLDIRGRTGATVVAVCRGEERIEYPEGSERLEVGDLLAVTGSEVSIEAASRLLQLE
jgi:CPA2 family monovalent cation:H+ antiporter-2